MSTDVLSNFLSSINNAYLAKKPVVEFFYTKEIEVVAKLMKEHAYLADVKVFKEKDSPVKKLAVYMSYTANGPALTNLKRVSHPGRRVYKRSKDLGKYLSGHGLKIVTTSRGVMSSTEASKRKLGGEVLCTLS